MTARGRPPIGPDIRVRIPVEVRDELQRRADAEGVPLAEIARRILVKETGSVVDPPDGHTAEGRPFWL